ncbi:Uncharacterized protein Fot_03272 [Forsythia ovata]|uniref:Uncharacterized protein n=1 Tax=Forsythia ovata TaxID=205694 RepID=A0ABD1XCA6_9LAMI
MADENVERINNIVAKKSYLTPSMSIKMRPPAKHQLTQIKDIPSLISEVKYDAIFLLDSITELDIPTYQENTSKSSFVFRKDHLSWRDKKKIVTPVKRTLFSLKDSGSSEDEDYDINTINNIPNCLIKNRDLDVATNSAEEDSFPTMVDDNMKFLDNLVSSKTHLSSKSLKISHPPPEKIVHIQDVPHMLNGENQNILNTVRTYTTYEHFLYLKAVNNSKNGTNMRYDVIFMLDPMLDTVITANEGELSVNDVILQDKNFEHPENISDFNVKDAQPRTLSHFSREFSIKDNAYFILLPDIAKDSGYVYANNYK